MSPVKGVVLYSGGLDSILASKILMDQGIELTGLHCILPFFSPDMDPGELESSKLAEKTGLKLVHYRCGIEYIEMLKNPEHGYGKHVNPCIDCKLFFMRKAAELMKELGAEFVATGEVVGQRPMSQLKHTLIHIEKISGIKGRLLRPLSAKLLEPTIPEIEGRVDRSRLLDISGRGRKRQMELAALYGIEGYTSPAGGCLFTDRFFAERVRDLFRYNSDATETDIYLLKIGRHFRINDTLKIIVSRDEPETIELERLKGFSDYLIRPDFKGPSVFIKGIMSNSDAEFIGSIIARYGKPEDNDNIVALFSGDTLIRRFEVSESADVKLLDQMRI